MEGINTGSARSWEEFEAQVKKAGEQGTRYSEAQKTAMIQREVTAADGGISLAGLRKIGQQFVGPILVRLKYEGVVRDLLVERVIPQGTLPQFPVWDKIGYAYVLNDYNGEIQASRYEAKIFPVPMVRVAARAIIPKAEVMAMNFDIVERAKQQMLENIMRREDERYYEFLNQTISDHVAGQMYLDRPHWPAYPGVAEYSITTTGNRFDPLIFTDAFGVISRSQLMPSKILLNTADYMDVFSWGVNSIGYAAVERLTDTGVMPRYGMADFKPSITCPKNVAYVQPDPQYVGFLATRWTPQVQEYHDPAKGEYGYVIDESIGYFIASSYGLVRLQKNV